MHYKGFNTEGQLKSVDIPGKPKLKHSCLSYPILSLQKKKKLRVIVITAALFKLQGVEL